MLGAAEQMIAEVEIFHKLSIVWKLFRKANKHARFIMVLNLLCLSYINKVGACKKEKVTTWEYFRLTLGHSSPNPPFLKSEIFQLKTVCSAFHDRHQSYCCPESSRQTGCLNSRFLYVFLCFA